ncbi:condensation domain-containing protein [Actinopolyspora mzabensis]|uniref:condensation domain-containing protein n=1 Tax=Actinopolyspora mzabensis TaxID=995066 RepID=UPI0015A1C519|nr:condensation domain-containing protein [Actinopolyspora mzabensis]
MVHGWRVRGPLDLDALRGALGDVVTRHEMLRTEIVRDEGEIHQRIHSPERPEVRVHDLEPDVNRSREEQVDDFVNEVEAGSLEVSVLPHLRVEVGRFDENDAVLVLVTHHTASDGWSLHVIVRDLAAYYARRCEGETVELPSREQYRDFVYWQQEMLAGPEAESAREYWREKLAGSRILDIDADKHVTDEIASVYSVRRFIMDQELTKSILDFSRMMRCSPFMTLLATLKLYLHRKTSFDDLVVPVITSGRTESSFHESVGPFFNMVPLRTSIEGCRSFFDFMLRVRATCLEGYSHELPFSEVVAQAPEIISTYERPDNAVVAIQVLQFPAMTESEVIGGLEYTEVRRRTKSYPETSDIPNGILLGMDILPDDEIAGTLRFDSNQFHDETIIEMIDSYKDLLRSVLIDPNRPLGSL